ncbi:MAG: hypothetical protein ACTSXL_00265 [Alphaproteobacteria bacterium]
MKKLLFVAVAGVLALSGCSKSSGGQNCRCAKLECDHQGGAGIKIIKGSTGKAGIKILKKDQANNAGKAGIKIKKK